MSTLEVETSCTLTTLWDKVAEATLDTALWCNIQPTCSWTLINHTDSKQRSCESKSLKAKRKTQAAKQDVWIYTVLPEAPPPLRPWLPQQGGRVQAEPLPVQQQVHCWQQRRLLDQRQQQEQGVRRRKRIRVLTAETLLLIPLTASPKPGTSILPGLDHFPATSPGSR